MMCKFSSCLTVYIFLGIIETQYPYPDQTKFLKVPHSYKSIQSLNSQLLFELFDLGGHMPLRILCNSLTQLICNCFSFLFQVRDPLCHKQFSPWVWRQSPVLMEPFLACDLICGCYMSDTFCTN